MKFCLSIVLLAVSAQAFAPAAFGVRSKTQLADKVDSSALVKEALEISKKFGASSVEARLAWETVEEVDSSDNSAATAGSLDECAVDEDAMSAACAEYSTKVEEMEKLLKLQGPAISALAGMAASVKAIKLAVPVVKSGTSSPELLEAMAEARALTEEKGITSSEAKIAWETVEELASADNSASLGGKMEADECLVDAAMDACAALEELQRVLDGAAK